MPHAFFILSMPGQAIRNYCSQQFMLMPKAAVKILRSISNYLPAAALIYKLPCIINGIIFHNAWITGVSHWAGNIPI
jgi:hypothetical protein